MINIRKIQDKDKKEILRLGSSEERFNVSKEVPSFWTEEQITDWINSKDDILLVAEESKKIIGYLLSRFHKPTGKIDFENLFVIKEFRNKGVANSLIERMLKISKEKNAKFIVGLIEKDNIAIKNLLERNGFKEGKEMLWMDKSFSQ